MVHTPHPDEAEWGGTAWVWEAADRPGHHHVAGIGRDFAFVDATRKPIAGEHGQGALFRAVDTILEDRHREMEFVKVSDRVADPGTLRASLEDFRRAVLAREPADAEEAHVLAERALAVIQAADARLGA